MKISHGRGMNEVLYFSHIGNSRSILGGADARIPASIGTSNVPSCLKACRTEFTKGLGIDAAEKPDNVLRSLCQNFFEDRSALWFWNLYCCDSKYCGVAVTGTAIRQDPNVDGIIDQCSNIGVVGIIDPGPPPVGRCGSRDDNPFEAISEIPDSFLHNHFTVLVETQIKSITSSFPATLIMATSTTPGTSTWTSMIATPTSNATTPGENSSSSNGLDSGGSIAAGLCAAMVALALLLALPCLRKWKEKGHSKGNMEALPVFGNHEFPLNQKSSNSNESLVTSPRPATSKPPTPMMPPMRLSDRKFLQHVLGIGSLRSSSAPPYSSQASLVLSQHPLFGHTAGRLQPNNERHATMSSSKYYLARNPYTNDTRYSMSSTRSGQGNISVIKDSKEAFSLTSRDLTNTNLETCSSSPTRPQRPQAITPENFSPLILASPSSDQVLPVPPVFQFQLNSGSPEVDPLKIPKSSITTIPIPSRTSPPADIVATPSDIGIAIVMERNDPTVVGQGGRNENES